MADSGTIDNKVKSHHSVWGEIWKENWKPALVYLGIALGAVYVLHGGYRFYQARAFLGEYEQLKGEETADLNRILTAEMEREKLGLGHDFSGQILRIELQNAIHSERSGRMDIIAEHALTEYNLVLNPFYEGLPQRKLLPP